MIMSKLLKPIIITAIVVVIGYLYISNIKPTQKIKSVPVASWEEYEDVLADLNGDGEQETLRLSNINTKDDLSVTSLVALDKNGTEIGRLPETMPIPVPFSNSGTVWSPFVNNTRQFVSFNFIVGPHSSETMFFALQDEAKAILPVCLTDQVKDEQDCYFWSGQSDELLVKDLDNDGNLEVVETVDEYPKNGPVAKDALDATNEAFKDLGQDSLDGAIRVLKRESGGRGKKVIWEIYQFNGNYFEKQMGDKYNKYYVLAKEYIESTYLTHPKVMQKSEMSQDSLDYNLFLRKYWTRR